MCACVPSKGVDVEVRRGSVCMWRGGWVGNAAPCSSVLKVYENILNNHDGNSASITSYSSQNMSQMVFNFILL